MQAPHDNRPGRAPTWRSRIVGHGDADPQTLVAHPENWRAHPRNQRRAMAGVLDHVGWVQDVIVNRRTGRILDGHLRVALALERGEATVLWGTNTRSCRFPIWLSAADPSFVVPHPRGETGTVFVTIEDESGDVQCVLWPRVFARSRQALRGLVLLVTGTVTRWDGTTTLAVAHVESVATRVPMPQAHDWH